MKRVKVISSIPLFDSIIESGSKLDKEFIANNLMIANQIIEIMEDKNMTQHDLANALNKSPAEISKWLSGFHNLTVKTITKIQIALGEIIILTPNRAINEIDAVINKIISNISKNVSIQTNNITKTETANFEFPQCKMIELHSYKYRTAEYSKGEKDENNEPSVSILT